MKVKPVDPKAVIRDPNTKLPLPAEGGEVPENNFWVRRWLGGEVLKWNGSKWVGYAADVPVGNEPVAPLTTREAKKG